MLLPGWERAGASPATAGVLLPGPASVAANPAYAAYPQKEWTLTGTALPVGLLGLLRQESNPLLYLSDRGRFRASFDLLSFYEQLAHPTELLLDPPRSPDLVVRTGAGRGLPPHRAGGSPRCSRGRA